MAAEDVARALIAMDDPGTRRRLAAGDFAGFALSPEEQSLVQHATPVLPDGDPRKVFLATLGDVEAHAQGEDGAGYWPEGTAAAIAYANERLDDPLVGTEFGAWIRSARDEFP